jgi:predicted flap endonuclease-1-like 5' DNA nuclease
MNKKILFWVFLITGIIWILGAGYWYIRIENLDLIKLNLSSNDPNTKAFLKAVSVVFIPLLITAFLFYFIGLLFGKKEEKYFTDIEKENEQLKSEIASHIDKIETMKVLYTGGKIRRRPANIIENTSTSPDIIKEEDKESKIYNETFQIKKDDLKIIEGIGERIEFFLNESGIYTWEQLSQQSVDSLKNILELYEGAAYRIHSPMNWPKLAELAAKGKWDDFYNLQKPV